MQKITRFSLTHSKLTIFFVIFIVVSGIYSFIKLPSQEDPQITIRNAEVKVLFPGMSAKMMETLIAEPIEKKLKQIPEIQEISTTIKTGSVLIKPKVADKYFDLAPIWQNLRNKMEDVRSQLPSGTIGPFVNDDYGRVAAAIVSITGEGYSYLELKGFAEDLQTKLGHFPSISRIDIHGIQEERIWIEFNSSQLSHYGVLPGNIIKELTEQNIILPSGALQSEGQNLIIEPTGNFKDLNEIIDLEINVPNSQGIVYLRDIATIKQGYVEPLNYPVYWNNKPSLVLSISMAPKYRINKFGEDLSKELTKFQYQLPLGVDLDLVTYQPEIVESAVKSATSNLYQTIFVVLAIVIVFLGWRTGLVVGLIVPLTILLSLSLMLLLDIELQRMSIAAIIISLGLLVDNGIVIAEDIKRRLDSGQGQFQSALSASRTLSLPLLTSSLTTILAFMPLMLAQNVVGEFVRSLGWVIIITLLGSWFLSIFVIPVFCSWFLTRHHGESLKADKFRKFTFIYHYLIKKILKQPKVFVLSLICILFISLLGFKFVTKQLMPPSERNQFLIYLDLPAGTYIQDTIDATRVLSKFLDDRTANPEVTGNISYVGYGGPRFFLALSPPQSGSNVAFFVVNTQNKQQVNTVMQRTERYIANNIPNARGRVKQMWLASSETGLVEYRISGKDEKVLFQYADKLEQAFRSIPGAYQIMHNWQNPELRVKVNVDQALARRNGISSETIAKALSAYFDGVKITDFRQDDKVVPIMLRGQGQDTIEQLRSLDLISINGQAVPLMQVAELEASPELSVIQRYNQQRAITVSAKHRNWQAFQLHEKMLAIIDNLNLPEGYSLSFAGEIQGSNDANAALFKYLPHCIGLMAMLMIWQFNSFVRMGIIMGTIPFVLIGVVVGLLITNAPLSFNAVLGIFSLAGIIINHAIVLIERIDFERKTIKCIKRAIIKASIARLRPIVMTTVTTVIGLLPLIFFGGDLWFGMGVVIAMGLLYGTIFSLGLVPALYYLCFKNPLKKLKTEQMISYVESSNTRTAPGV